MGNIDATVNHYELPNLAQCNSGLLAHNFIVLYDFTNKEHDMIMRCFRIGNCNYSLINLL